MANEDKPKLDYSSGLKAMRTVASGNGTSNYGKTPSPGFVLVPCKNEQCTGAVESGLVFNVEEWIVEFISEDRECSYCHLKAIYSRDDVEFVLE